MFIKRLLLADPLPPFRSKLSVISDQRQKRNKRAEEQAHGGNKELEGLASGRQNKTRRTRITGQARDLCVENEAKREGSESLPESKHLRDENTRLRKLVTDLMLDKIACNL